MLGIWGLSTGTAKGTGVGVNPIKLSLKYWAVLLFVKTLNTSRSESMDTSPNIVNTLIWKRPPSIPAMHFRLVGERKRRAITGLLKSLSCLRSFVKPPRNSALGTHIHRYHCTCPCVKKKK